MRDQYERLECIGSGSFGQVFKARDVSTGELVALKLVDLEKADDEIDVIQREIKVMSQISNPYVVQYYSSLMKGSTLCIVMEYMSAGSLKQLLDVVGPFPEEAVATVMRALFRGLDYVHKGRKVHRDIKAANILLSDAGDVKLADFGVAGQMTATMRQRNTFVGSPFWMAPEVIQKSMYDEKADIWSAGITGMELANGLPPYATEHPYRALFLIPKNDPPRLEGSQFSRAFKDFIALCLHKNPSERPSAEHLLGHAFLRKARSSSIKELLKRKQATSLEDGVDKVVIGGDTFVGSPNGTFRENPSPQAQREVTENTNIVKFDFGSLTDETPVPDPTSDEDGEQTGEKDQSAVDTTQQNTKENLGTTTEVSKAQPEIPPVAPENKVLSELILPVISQIRASADTTGAFNEVLMSSLGTLEVAFVDAETAKPGVSTELLESLLVEAFASKTPELQDLIARVTKRAAHGT